MLIFIFRRLFYMLLTALAIVYFSFFSIGLINNASPDAPTARGTDAAGEAWHATVAFFGNALSGDLGTVPTVSGDRPVWEIAKFAYKNSLGLLGMAFLAAVPLGFIIGLLAALTRRKSREYTLLLSTLIGISLPSFTLAVLLQQAGIKYTVTFGSRLVSMGGYAWDFQHLLLPLLVLIARPMAYITRTTYISLTTILEEDYIRTAFAKGLTLSRTLIVHALRNLGISVLTGIGISLRFSLGVLPIVEFIFAWPGLGLSTLESISNRIPLQVATLALLIGLTLQAASLLLDISYQFIDPRLRSAS